MHLTNNLPLFGHPVVRVSVHGTSGNGGWK